MEKVSQTAQFLSFYKKNEKKVIEYSLKLLYITKDTFIQGCVERRFRKVIADGTKDFLKIHFWERGILYLRPESINENSEKRGCVLSLVQCFACLERALLCNIDMGIWGSPTIFLPILTILYFSVTVKKLNHVTILNDKMLFQTFID